MNCHFLLVLRVEFFTLATKKASIFDAWALSHSGARQSARISKFAGSIPRQRTIYSVADAGCFPRPIRSAICSWVSTARKPTAFSPNAFWEEGCSKSFFRGSKWRCTSRLGACLSKSKWIRKCFGRSKWQWKSGQTEGLWQSSQMPGQ